MTTDTPKKIHQGRNVKRFREMLGIKQEALAAELGDDWTQKRISVLEQQESIEPELLGQVAEVLRVPMEAIRNFSEEAAVSYINTFHDSSKGDFNYHCTFNPIEKIVQLYDEKVALLERLLESEREKRELLKERANRT